MPARKSWISLALAAASVVVAGVVTPSAGAATLPVAGTGTQTSAHSRAADCPGASDAEVSVFRKGIPVLEWRENLEFDGLGNMWVTKSTGGVEGYRPDGTRFVTVPMTSPAGIRRGPDGMMYVNYGLIPIGSDTGIARFDPAHSEKAPVKVVRGLSGINGLAIDRSGNFYLGREFSSHIQKIRPDGTEDKAWTEAADVSGTNGMAIADGTLYTTSTFDLSSPVEAVPLDDPAAHRRLADLTEPPLGIKLPDDLTVVGDHLYVVAFGSGQVIRVDRSSGAVCVAADGLTAPTSVRAPYRFGDHDPAKELFVTEASGRIVNIRLG